MERCFVHFSHIQHSGENSCNHAKQVVMMVFLENVFLWVSVITVGWSRGSRDPTPIGISSNQLRSLRWQEKSEPFWLKAQGQA